MKILIDQFVQEWHAKDTQSHKALTYFSFKHKFELETKILYNLTSQTLSETFQIKDSEP